MTETQDRTSIEYLKDTLKIGFEAYQSSREEAATVWDMYHNRHYTAGQLAILENRGQPAETFNIVKLFSRLLLGYYSTVINSIQTLPVGPEDTATSTLLNDVIDHTLRDNNFIEEGEKVKLSGIIAGLMCVHVNVAPTGRKDEFGRPINKVVLEHVPDDEVIIDPMSYRDDFKDARFIHRYKWLSEEAVIDLFGKRVLDKLTEYYNFTEVDDADFEEHHFETFAGQYRLHNNYMIVHSVVSDDNGDNWEIFWHDEYIISKEKITHKEVKSPYRVVVTHTSKKSEYYGIFRDVIETQKAINQALIKFQLLINTQKAFVQKGAVDNIADFTNSFNRVTGVIEVNSLAGYKIESLSREALEQYAVIDKGFDRIQRVLGINDSFLGMAFASDSGRKVKLQQNATIIALRYLTSKLETLYRFLGWDIANLIKQYYTATQAIRVADDMTGQRWITLNEPLQQYTGDIDPRTGQPQIRYVYEEVLDPASGEPLIDEEGNYVVAPIPTAETDISFSNVDIEILTTAYNDEDEKNQLMLETVLSGATGQLLSQVNPAGFFKAASLSMQSVKTKNSPEIAQIFNNTAQMLGADQQAQQQASLMAQGGGQGGQQVSQELKLPQNTNEGA